MKSLTLAAFAVSAAVCGASAQAAGRCRVRKNHNPPEETP